MTTNTFNSSPQGLSSNLPIDINYSNTTIKDFISYIITCNNIDEILNTCKTPSEKGFIYERLFDIVIKFGFCEKFTNNNFNHLVGNVNNGTFKTLNNFEQYLNEKVFSGNSGGCSDITLQNKHDNTYIFISSKYLKENDKKQKSVNSYDIQNIVAMADKNKHIYINYKIYLVVIDKKLVLENVKNSKKSSDYITKYMTNDTILDKSDLNKYFLEFKQDITKHLTNNIWLPNITSQFTDIYLSPKEKLILRFHQELIAQKTSDLIEKNNKTFLWGCKCRSGKTYMVGGIILKQYEIKQKSTILQEKQLLQTPLTVQEKPLIQKNLNILIITPAPTETLPQFTDDLFNKFKDFDNFKIHTINTEKLKTLVLGENNIFVISKQFLQRFTNELTIMQIKNLNLDIIAFDETHFSGTTQLSKNILNSYSSDNTVKIYLTATYNKPLKEWNIPVECQMYWDIEDEQICKSIIINDGKTNNNGNINNSNNDTNNSNNDTNNINNNNSNTLDNGFKNLNLTKLKEKHGNEYITSTITKYTLLGKSINEIFEPYLKMPDLHLITTMFDSQKYDEIKKNIMGSHYGFSFDVLFSLNKNKQFNCITEIKTILKYITGSEKEIDYKTGDNSIFRRITKLALRTPFTQIWFLPSDNINLISQNLKLLMLEDKILKNYKIICINRQNNELAKDVKSEIDVQEVIAKAEGKQGLILLAGNMLSLGITIDSCDVVFLLNNALSSDKVTQQMYRCMTEGENKKMGFVVDLNISRVLHTCINYTIHKNNNGSIEDKIKYLIENHLINIDNDLLISKKINSDEIIKKLMDIWKSDPINSFKTLLKNLDDDYVMFDNATQKLLNASFTQSLKGENVNLTVELKNEGEILQDLQTGKEIIKDDNICEENIKDNNIGEEHVEKEEEIKISFSKDVLPYIIPLTCILTIKNKNKDFTQMLNDIKNNKELLEIFDDQCLVWWNKKDLITIISNIIDKYFTKISNTYNISVQFKLSIQSLLDKPKELLELISDCLKPKTIEKKTFGEVFTPIDFINNSMLKDIEDYWFKKHNISIWSDEKITWYDPATGMGNYPIAIYYKLMEGLKLKIPNNTLRQKHIIEKQLFMGELNKKNCFVIKQIFNINNEFRLNLYEGDTLKINLIETFNKQKFDIIIGNPPYNEELTNIGAKPLYNKFIEYYLDKSKLLSFIVPSRWFAGGKGLDNFRNMMINRTDILFIKHFNDASKIFGNTVNIEGGVNYFLINNEYNGLCNYNGSMVKFNNFDIILDSKYYGIVNKCIEYDNITKLYLGRYFGIESNDKNLSDDNKLIKCYVSQQKGFIKYVDSKNIKKVYNFYKVITARANGSNGCFGNIFIGNELEIYTGSYISFKVSTEFEAKSLLSYMNCKLPNFMLSLRKISQDISESTCKWIPLPTLDKIWEDESVYSFFKLTIDEIKLVKETKIIGYNDVKPIVNNNFINDVKPIVNNNLMNDVKPIVNNNPTNDVKPTIIKDGRKQYYLIGDNLYKVKQDKTQGILFGKYIDNKIIENK